MAYSVVLSKKARKFLRDFKDARQRQRLEEAIEDLAEQPRPSGVKQLTASDGLHRIRVGDYRILYSIQDARLLVLILEVGDRKDIYR